MLSFFKGQRVKVVSNSPWQGSKGTIVAVDTSLADERPVPFPIRVHFPDKNIDGIFRPSELKPDGDV